MLNWYPRRWETSLANALRVPPASSYLSPPRSTIADALRIAAQIWESVPFGVLAIAVASMVVFGVAVRQAHLVGSGGDIYYFLARVNDLLAGRDPYADSAAASLVDPSDGDFADIYFYSPALYWLLSPLALVKPSIAFDMYAAIAGLCLILGSVCLAHAAGLRWATRAGLLLALAIVMTPMTREELFFGNVDVVLFVCLSASFLAARRGRHTLAGAVLGLGAVAYIQSLPFVLYYVWKREYRAAASGALLFGVLTGLGFLFAPATALANFGELTQRFLGVWAAWWVNQSLYAVLLRVFDTSPYSAQPLILLPCAPRVAWFVGAVVATAAAARVITRGRISATPANVAVLEFGLAISVLLACFPVLEANTFLVMGLSFGAIAFTVGQRSRSREWRTLGFALAVAYAISCVGMLGWSFHRLGAFRDLEGWALVLAAATSAPYVYLALVMVALACCALLLQRRCEPA